MIYRKEVVSNLPNDFAWSGRATSRPRQIVDIQYNTTIMDGREVSRPYRDWFLFQCPQYLSTEQEIVLNHKSKVVGWVVLLQFWLCA